MINDLSQFHFIRPEWLLLVIVVVALWWFIRKASAHQQWQHYLPEAMLQALKVDGRQRSNLWHWWLLASWLILTVAMAGPTWIKQAVPLVKNQKALILVLDLSQSMLADDLTPDRLTLAKYKLIDILSKQSDGQVALIAYAGDAHTVSPLTDDPRTIEALLPALHPNVMPITGSNIEAAIELSQNLLADAGVLSGNILVLTDGMTTDAINEVEERLSSEHTLSILGVGSREATPIKLASGGFLRNRAGEIVLASVNRNELQGLAGNLGGRFSDISTDDTDINYLLSNSFEANNDADPLNSNSSFDAWKDLAHWLILLILPLALLCFRKGVIYLVPIIIFSPLDSQAADTSFWKNIWKTPDQQAVELLNNEQFKDAADTFNNSDWSGIAQYKNGDFTEAAKQFSKNNTDLDSAYNHANALAMSGELEQAIEAYNKVLDKQADHADALHNKQVIESLLEQQEEQEQQENQQGDQGEENQEQEQEQQESDQQDSQDQDSSESESDSQSNSEQDSSDGEESSSDEETSESESPNDQPTDETSPEEQEQKSESDEKTDEELTEEEQKAKADEEAKSDESESSDESKPGDIVPSDQEPLKDSSEQWLRTIQDDPSGLLRRKFDYQSRQRNKKQNNSQQDRY